jgi:hypothetical protein
VRLLASCGHEFNWPDTAVHPEKVKCAACGRFVAIYGVDLKPEPDPATGRARSERRAPEGPPGEGVQARIPQEKGEVTHGAPQRENTQ